MDTLNSLSDPLDLPDDGIQISPFLTHPLIEVHSVTLHPHDKCKSYMIYGRVYVCDNKEGRNDLYKRGWSNPETITTSGDSLSLTGMISGGVISMVGEPKVFIQLKVRPKSRKKKGLTTTWFAKVASVLDTTTHLCYDEIKSITLQGSLGDVCVHYIVMPCASIAYVKISLTREGEQSPDLEANDDVPDDIANARVFGSVIASYDTTCMQFGGESYHKQSPSFTLYDQQCEDKGNPVAYDIPIKLDRSFVCKPAFSSFLLTLNLTFKTCGDNTQKIVVKKSIRFENGIFQEQSFCVGEFSVEVLLMLVTSKHPFFLEEINKSPELLPSAFRNFRNVPEEICHWGRARVEVLSVFVGHEERKEIDDLWGVIQLSFFLKSNRYYDIFRRDEKQPYKLTRRGKALSLEGFTTDWTDSFCLYLRLKDISGLVDIHRELYFNEVAYDATNNWFVDRPICAVMYGKHGFAVVHYIIFTYAAKAIVNISVVANKKVSDYCPAVYGALVAQYSCYEYSTTFQKNYWRSVLFEEPQEKDARQLSENGLIPLSKNLVSVPMCSSLVIDVDLHAIVRPSAGVTNDSLDVCAAAEHFKDNVELKIGDSGCKKLLGEYFDVYFSTEWTNGT